MTNKIRTLFTAAFIICTFATGYAQTADEIMSRHEQAMGGIDNWNKVKTLIMRGAVLQGGNEIGVTQTIVVGKAMRTDISVMGMAGWQIITTDHGWSYMPFMGAAKVDTMKPEQVLAQQKQLNITGNHLLDNKTNGTKTELLGKDTISDVACYKMKITDKEGNESIGYFDCSNYYMLRRETKTSRDGGTEDVIVYKEFQKLDVGIVLPMVITTQGADITFTAVDVNKNISDDVFKPIVSK